MPNPIRGRKVRISSSKKQKKTKPDLHCQCGIRRGIKVDNQFEKQIYTNRRYAIFTL
jgi:hypothetical protein